MAPTLAFFDLDGCLVDSSRAIVAAMRHALAAVGAAVPPPSLLHRHIGPPLLAAFTEMLDDAELAEHAVDIYRQAYRRTMMNGTVAVGGVEDALAELSARCTLAVVTTKPRVFAGPIIEAVGLATYFDGVFAPAVQATAETKTETLRRALDAQAADTAGAWMVGDRHHDIDAGRALGLGTVGVTWGIGDRTELQAAGAHAIVDDPSEIPAVILAGHGP